MPTIDEIKAAAKRMKARRESGEIDQQLYADWVRKAAAKVRELQAQPQADVPEVPELPGTAGPVTGADVLGEVTRAVAGPLAPAVELVAQMQPHKSIPGVPHVATGGDTLLKRMREVAPGAAAHMEARLTSLLQQTKAPQEIGLGEQQVRGGLPGFIASRFPQFAERTSPLTQEAEERIGQEFGPAVLQEQRETAREQQLTTGGIAEAAVTGFGGLAFSAGKEAVQLGKVIGNAVDEGVTGFSRSQARALARRAMTTDAPVVVKPDGPVVIHLPEGEAVLVPEPPDLGALPKRAGAPRGPQGVLDPETGQLSFWGKRFGIDKVLPEVGTPGTLDHQIIRSLLRARDEAIDVTFALEREGDQASVVLKFGDDRIALPKQAAADAEQSMGSLLDIHQNIQGIRSTAGEGAQAAQQQLKGRIQQRFKEARVREEQLRKQGEVGRRIRAEEARHAAGEELTEVIRPSRKRILESGGVVDSKLLKRADELMVRMGKAAGLTPVERRTQVANFRAAAKREARLRFEESLARRDYSDADMARLTNKSARARQGLMDFLKFEWLVNTDVAKTFGRAGHEFMGNLNAGYSTATRRWGQQLSQYRKMTQGFGDVEKDQMIRLLRGEELTVAPKVRAAAQFVRDTFTDVAERLQNGGVMVRNAADETSLFAARKNYVPQQWRQGALEEFKASRGDVEAAARANNVSYETMLTRINGYQKRLANLQYGHADFGRQLNLPPALQAKYLESDLDNIFINYVRSGHRRAEMAKRIGVTDVHSLEGNRLINAWADQIEDPVKRESFMRWVSRAVGHETFDPNMTALAEMARSFQVMTKMRLSGIRAWNSMTFGITRADPTLRGFANTLKTMFTKLDDGTIAAAARTGEFEDLLVRTLNDQGEVELAKWFLNNRALSGGGVQSFAKAEFKVRATAVKISQDSAKRIVKRGSKATGVQELHLTHLLNDGDDMLRAATEAKDAIRRGKLTQDQLDRIGRHMVDQTQPLQPGDITHYGIAPAGQVRQQFRSSLNKEARNVWRLLKEDVRHAAASGPRGQLARKRLTSWFFMTQLLGEGQADFQALLSGRRRTRNPLLRIIENAVSSTGLGWPYAIIMALKYNRYGSLLEMYMGPTAGSVSDTVDTLKGAATLDAKAVGKGVTGQLGIPGRQRLFPPKDDTPSIEKLLEGN